LASTPPEVLTLVELVAAAGTGVVETGFSIGRGAS
jgi:hypothetical protein